MPKKKKNFGASPSRKNTNPETVSATDASSSPASLHGINKEKLISGLSEMFSDLDPTVIYMVLSECDFRVEETMDYLLELSTAAKDTVCSTKVSGFDSLSALLIGGNNSSCSTHELEGHDTTAVAKSSEEPSSSEELALLIDNSLEDRSGKSEAKKSENDHHLGSLNLARDHNNSNCTELYMNSNGTAIENWLTALKPSYKEAAESTSISEIETKDILTQSPESNTLPEVVLDSGAVSESVMLADKAESYTEPNQTHNVLFDFTAVSTLTAQRHQIFAKIETNAFPNSPASLQEAEGQENVVALRDNLKQFCVPDLCAGSGLKWAPLTRETDPPQQTWRSQFSLFQKYPQRFHFYPAFEAQWGNHSFVTPIAVSPGRWRPASDCGSQGKTFCSPEVSKSWESLSCVPKRCANKNGRPRHHFSQDHQLPGGHIMNRRTFAGHVLVLLRGLPGSGKSYLARVLLEDNPCGIILSTDDYFYQKNGQYQFDADCLADAHEWNWKRAKEAFEKRITPIIIDNTNTQAWEMKPYIALSQQHKYKVIFREPDTWWKFKPKELESGEPTLFEQLHPGKVDDVLSLYAADFQEQESLSTAGSAESSAASDVFPYMDHWNVHTQRVSLREIMSEEIALQEKLTGKPFPWIAKKDCAAKLKEKQLLELFPTINANFLMDIFKDYNYSLEQTVQFLNSVLEADPIKTVIAKEPAQNARRSPSNTSKTRDKKAKRTKELEDILSEKGFQDTQYPGYEDFRAEAFLHQQQRQECLRKAGEAYRMGMKPVAAFYVQQGQLHEQKMKEANQDAAQQIFEKVNAAKLPINFLDLHGLHVDEALAHLSRVLQEKTKEHSLAGGIPYLYVITGRGNHSQGGVARIKPAVTKYLTSHKFRFTEIKSGCFKILLE
ncbi:NEDD4-binding protein 2 [Notechis scutatus]|uniref:NEDD4-binding protein 2 n=1 Tax=Notechis scutatus TaxID=8663 RepID=A0A6J1UU35_9SAUR|nr:NEDD4-binding protein 2 [Notechis scutatus]